MSANRKQKALAWAIMASFIGGTFLLCTFIKTPIHVTPAQMAESPSVVIM